MKLTPLLLAALVALPTALVGCDAADPDTAYASLQPVVLSPEAPLSLSQAQGPISGPTQIEVGDLVEYLMEGADVLRVKNLGGLAEVEEEGTRSSDGAAMRYIRIRAVEEGPIQIEGHHPQFGQSSLSVSIGPPPPSGCEGAAGAIAGPQSLGLGEEETYTATCAHEIRAGAQSTGSVQFVSQTQGSDAFGRPTVQVVLKGMALGNVRLRSKLDTDAGRVSGPLFNLSVTSNPPAMCDETPTTVNGITGPGAIRSGETGDYYASGATEELSVQNMSAQLTIIEHGAILGPVGGTTARVVASGNGFANISTSFPDGPASRTVRVCPAP